jgi:hypothetical protein
LESFTIFQPTGVVCARALASNERNRVAHIPSLLAEVYRPVNSPTINPCNPELPFLPSGRFYRVTEASLDGNWPKYDPNYKKSRPYLVKVPEGEGYSPEMVGKLTIGQAWGRIRYAPDLRGSAVIDALAPKRASDNTKAACPDLSGSQIRCHM